jgi:hypothetical protein
LIPVVLAAAIVGANVLGDQKDVTSLPPVGEAAGVQEPVVTTLANPAPTAGAETQSTVPATLPSSGPGLVEFDEVGEVRLIGSAAASGTVLRLTPSTDRSQAGAAWLTAKQAVGAGFEATFRFQISGVERNPGDGFAFVIQNTSDSAIGSEGIASGIGYKRMPNSVAVEFDTVLHDYERDPSGNHIAVHTGGTGPNTAHQSASLGSASPPFQLWDGRVHTVRIEYTPGMLTVFLDDSTNAVLSVELDLADTLRLDDGGAWVGFTASTEPGFRENHDILGWSFSSS